MLLIPLWIAMRNLGIDQTDFRVVLVCEFRTSFGVSICVHCLSSAYSLLETYIFKSLLIADVARLSNTEYALQDRGVLAAVITRAGRRGELLTKYACGSCLRSSDTVATGVAMRLVGWVEERSALRRSVQECTARSHSFLALTVPPTSHASSLRRGSGCDCAIRVRCCGEGAFLRCL